MDKKLQRVDNLMKETFGEQAELLDSYGPVQMCVFGLTYKFRPTGEKIIFECERGIIIVQIEKNDGSMIYPNKCFKESDYYHYEDHDEDLKELVRSAKRLLEK